MFAVCAEDVSEAEAVLTPVVLATLVPPHEACAKSSMLSVELKFTPPVRVISNVGVLSLPGEDAGELNAMAGATGGVLSYK